MFRHIGMLHMIVFQNVYLQFTVRGLFGDLAMVMLNHYIILAIVMLNYYMCSQVDKNMRRKLK